MKGKMGSVVRRVGGIAVAALAVWLATSQAWAPCGTSIGDRVWLDVNRNGLQDAGEPGVNGVTVTLLTDEGELIDTAVTYGDGFYEFLSHCPATLVVVVTPPPGYSLTTPCSTAMDIPDDSNCNPASVTIDADENNPTIDFGLVTSCAGSIGDFVWNDLNRDGIQDAGEPGINGVTVRLRDGANAVITTRVTAPGPNGDGYYSFSGLCQGTYFVEVITSTLPPGFAPSPCGTSQSTPNDSNCSPQRVDLASDDTYNPTIDFGYNQQDCGLTVDKTCALVQTGQPSFVCSNAKPIDSITMIWNGTETINVRAWKGAVGTILLATVSNVTVGQEVAVHGYAGSPNDVFWEIYRSSSGTKIGESTFHLSCSDIDMNGPEDCGKTEGDGKAKVGFINQWIFEGMGGNGSTLDCTPASGAGNSTCTIPPPPPPPHCIGKPKSVTFLFVGGPCPNPVLNTQLATKQSCSGDAGTGPVRIVVTNGGSATFLNQTGVDIGDVVKAAASNAGLTQLGTDTYYRIESPGGAVLQQGKLHTSCSQPLNLGDQFGSLKVVGLETTTGGVVANGADIRYSYSITNVGGVNLFDVTATDDQLGIVPGSPVATLPVGANVVLTTTAFIDHETVNVVDVVAETAAGGACVATDSARVLIGQDTQACSVLSGQFKLGDNKIEWTLQNAGSSTATISRIDARWPSVQGNLKKAKLAANTIFDGNLPPPTATIMSFAGSTATRQIGAGATTKLTLEFSKRSTSDRLSDYQIGVTFAEGCTVQIGGPAASEPGALPPSGAMSKKAGDPLLN